MEVKEFIRIYFRRNFEGEFRDILDFEDFYGNKYVFVILYSFFRLDLVKLVMEKCDCVLFFK